MSTKRVLLTVLAASAMLLALGIGSQLAGGGVYARPPAQQPVPPGASIPYPGRLNDAAGQPVPDGTYDFTFTLYDTETGGAPLWSEVQAGVAVQGGAFQALLGAVQPIPPAALDGGDRWLEVAVRGPGEADFTALAPRQRLSAASTAPDSASAPPSCPHDHIGEVWVASVPWANGAFKVTNNQNGPSVWGANTGGGNAVRGDGYGTSIGVYGDGDNGPGVVGRSTNSQGVEGHSTNGYGVLANSTNSDSIRVNGAGQHALNVQSSGGAAIYVHSAGGSGVYVNSAGGSGMTIDSATFDGIMINSAGDDGVHVNPTVGSGVCYRCGWKEDDGFVVLNTGEVRSSVGFGTTARDFAVVMDVEGTKASYEPGDVLVASDTGKGTTERSAAPYSPAVVGVYSAAPGFLGGRPVSDKQVSGVPVVILGVVSCKVSAENGPIRPGDLLVTSSTPGHAMRADRDSASPGTVLGKALESLDASQGTGVILVLVTLQ